MGDRSTSPTMQAASAPSAALPLCALLWCARSDPAPSAQEHVRRRAQLMQAERQLELGAGLHLTAREDQANVALMVAKHAEVDAGFEDVTTFSPAQHFFLAKDRIQASPIFRAIRAMPKGAALHVHDTALIGGDYILKNITYRDNLYICAEEDSVRLVFAASTPKADNCRFQLLKDVREASGDVEAFDANLAKFFTLQVEDPITEYRDINCAWKKFNKIFETITPMLTYKPVWEDYFYEALKQFREDNVLYMEVRTTLPDLYDLEGNIYDSVQCARVYKEVNDRFLRDYPDSFGARIIYAPLRAVGPNEVNKYVEIAKTIKSQLGDFVAGFDLVGQEDKGKPLKEFTDELLAISGMNVYYHAGETNWFGTESDSNLIDAIIFGAKRIGHGFALLKHPLISELVKSRGIAIEVNPISNQVLKLVDDMRNHPASEMLANNYPVVISSDDPGLWGALPLSHDFYETFMGIASRHSDIRLLKQLALNSLYYSSMPKEEVNRALQQFNNQWDSFISRF